MRLPGARGDHIHCTMEPSSCHLRCRHRLALRPTRSEESHNESSPKIFQIWARTYCPEFAPNFFEDFSCCISWETENLPKIPAIFQCSSLASEWDSHKDSLILGLEIGDYPSDDPEVAELQLAVLSGAPPGCPALRPFLGLSP